MFLSHTILVCLFFHLLVTTLNELQTGFGFSSLGAMPSNYWAHQFFTSTAWRGRSITQGATRQSCFVMLHLIGIALHDSFTLVSAIDLHAPRTANSLTGNDWYLQNSLTTYMHSPDGVIRIFHSHNPLGRTMALGLKRPLTEISTRNISWG
jgi:hypothetical protein